MGKRESDIYMKHALVTCGEYAKWESERVSETSHLRKVDGDVGVGHDNPRVAESCDAESERTHSCAELEDLEWG